MDEQYFLESFLVKGLYVHTYACACTCISFLVCKQKFWGTTVAGIPVIDFGYQDTNLLLIWVIFSAVLGEVGILHSGKEAKRRELLPLGKWAGLGQVDALTCNFESLAPDTDWDDGEMR